MSIKQNNTYYKETDGKIYYYDNEGNKTDVPSSAFGDIDDKISTKLDTSAFEDVSGTFYTTDNPSGFIDKTVNDLTNYYTTGQTYTQQEINEKLAEFGGFEVVSLTTDENPVPDVPSDKRSTKIIYLTKEDSSTKTDPYTEWIFTSADVSTTAWEVIGETTVDLSDYQTTAAMSSYYTKSETSGASEISTALTEKQDILTFNYNNTTITGINSSAVGQVLQAGTDLVINNGVIGVNTNGIAQGTYSFAEGQLTSAVGGYSHAEGNRTSAGEYYSHAEGNKTSAHGKFSHSEGSGTNASGICSHAEGYNNVASGDASHAEGNTTIAGGNISHAEGSGTSAIGRSSHVEGETNIAAGRCSHAEGGGTEANGPASHTEGFNTSAINDAAHAEGFDTIASGYYSHAEGSETIAVGYASHAEGEYTSAVSDYSHAEGQNTIAGDIAMHVGGKNNKTSANAAFVIGNGTSNDARSDAFIVDWIGIASATTFKNADGIIPTIIPTATQPDNTTACTLYVDANGKYYIVTSN